MKQKSKGRPKKSDVDEKVAIQNKKHSKDKSKQKETENSVKRYNQHTKSTPKDSGKKMEFFDDLGDKLAEFKIISPNTKEIGDKTIKLYDVFDLTDSRDRVINSLKTKALSDLNLNVLAKTAKSEVAPFLAKTKSLSKPEVVLDDEKVKLIESGKQKLIVAEEIDSQFDEQNDYCHICIDGGKIILWDKWPKVFHRECLEIHNKPKDKSWECPYCKGEWINLWVICDGECKKFTTKEFSSIQTKYKMQSEDKEVENKIADKRTRYSKIGIECSLCKCLTHSKCIELPMFAYLESPKYFL